MTDLKRCSRCKCTVLVETYFSKNRKGEYNKTCNGCLTKTREFRRRSRERDKTKFACKDCDAKFAVDRELQRHIKQIHLKIKDFECKDCDYKCSANGDLQRHIKRTHLKIKNFACKDCDYKCSENGTLQRHIKGVHLKIKDFECPTCDSKFSANGDLQAHIKRIHLKIKNFECPTCDYKFASNGDLQTHIKTCTGESNCSSGEFKIKKILDEMNIEYDHNSSYELKNEDGKWLRWDFIIEALGDPIFIEYDGRQHFEPVCFGGMSQEKAKKAFQKQKSHDKLKDDYCCENGFLLLRIAYTQFGNIPQIVTEFMCEHTDWGYE